MLRRGLILRVLRVDPNVAIGAKDARDGRLAEELVDVAFHPAHQVVVYLHDHPVLELAVLLSARMQLDFAVKSADLLHLCRD